jgi:hypothetical protein
VASGYTDEQGPIPLFSELTHKGAFTTGSGQVRTAGGSKMTVTFTAPDIAFTMDDRQAAASYAAVIEKVVGENLRAAKDFNGNPLPASAPATLERRADRLAQAQRGGRPHERFTDPKFVAKVGRNFLKRFTAPKLGHMPPLAGMRTFGLESGMLALSPKVVAEAGKFVMYFAGPRANTRDGKGTAVSRVFQRIGLFTAEGLKQPGIQEGLVQLKKDLFQSRLMRAGKLLSQLARNAQDLVQRAEEAAEVDASE